MIGRRRFLGLSSTMTLAVASGRGWAMVNPVAANERARPMRLGFAAFSRQVDSCFELKAGTGEPVCLRLLETRPYRPLGAGWQNAPDARNERYSLFFDASAGVRLPQGTYQVTHNELGTMNIFIVPMGETGDSLSYEAVFNHPPQAGPIAIPQSC